MKRLLDCDTSDLRQMNKEQILQSLQASEGRVIVQEISLFHTDRQLLEPISDAEVACAFGADLILLNAFDCEKPVITGIDAPTQEVVHVLKKYIGRLVGINLEPLGNSQMISDFIPLSQGRIATLDNARKAKDLGIDYIVLTGNPGSGVDNDAIERSIRDIHQDMEDMIIVAGKMHAAGSKTEAGENILTKEWVERFIQAGADIILIPAPGTVPGITQEYVHGMVTFVHEHGKMTMTAIGTSQESAEERTIEQIALMCKMTGTDIHHIGDAGLGGMVPESIMAYSKVIRGKRHTYLRMARSVNR